MKIIFFFVLGLFLFFCPIAVQAEEIAESPSLDPMSEEANRFLKCEDFIKVLFLGKATKF